MKRLAIVAALLMISAVLLIQVTPAFAGDKNPPQTRELLGSVLNKADVPLADAIVYIKNTKTMAVKTYITGKDGKYRFPALSHNVDYSIYAEYQGKRSDTKTLSSFDSRGTAHITLKIDAAQ